MSPGSVSILPCHETNLPRCPVLGGWSSIDTIGSVFVARGVVEEGKVTDGNVSVAGGVGVEGALPIGAVVEACGVGEERFETHGGVVVSPGVIGEGAVS